MPDSGYSLQIDAQNNLQVKGKIYMDNVKDACMQGCALINTLPRVQVDMAGVVDADSSSLAMLIEWVRTAKLQNKEIVFNNLPRFILDLGRVCGLDTVLPIGRTIKFDN